MHCPYGNPTRPAVLNACKHTVSGSGIAVSSFANGYAVASNFAKHELRTAKKVITRTDDILKMQATNFTIFDS